MTATRLDKTRAGTPTSSGRTAENRTRDPLETQAPARSARRYAATRLVVPAAAKVYARLRVEGLTRLPAGPFVLCFNHQNWADPLFVFGAMPGRPRIFFFGPEQEEMRRGVRNRLMRWAGVAVPFRPGSRGLVAATARARALLGDGAIVAIAGEGRIHAGEGALLPLQAGPAYLALRAGAPVVPMAVNGTSWLGFRRVVRVRIGLPISIECRTPSRPTSEAVDRLTAQIQSALQTLVADFPDQPRPGRIGRWLTELFNTWPDGSRPQVSTDESRCR
jgi:1-acyl-sn-glycerol-3-phosphate acyltransferase